MPTTLSPRPKKGVVLAKAKAPVIGPKKGATKACGHPGCKVVLRYTLDGWKHGVRNWTYDHEPVG